MLYNPGSPSRTQRIMSSGQKDLIETTSGNGNGAIPPSDIENNGGGDNGGGDDEEKEGSDPELLNLAEVFNVLLTEP